MLTHYSRVSVLESDLLQTSPSCASLFHPAYASPVDHARRPFCLHAGSRSPLRASSRSLCESGLTSVATLVPAKTPPPSLQAARRLRLSHPPDAARPCRRTATAPSSRPSA